MDLLPKEAILRELQMEVQKLLLDGKPYESVALARRYLSHYENDALVLSIVADCVFAAAAAASDTELECDSIRLVERAIEIEPENPRWLVALADMYGVHNALPANYTRAADLYRHALRLDPTNEAACSRMASLYGLVESLSLQEAIGYAQRALELTESPSMLEHFTLARLLEAAHHTAEACKQYTKALVLLNAYPDHLLPLHKSEVSASLQKKIEQLCEE